MKRHRILLAALVLAIVGAATGTLTNVHHRFAGNAAPLSNVQHGYQQVNSVTADDTYLVAGTRDWDNINGSAPNFFPVPPEWNTIELTFYGYGDGTGVGDPDGATFSYQVYACRKYGGAIIAYTGTGAMGTTQLSVNPETGAQFWSGAADPNYTWCDTLATTTDDWMDTVVLAGEGATNNIATTTIPWNGYWGLWVAIKDMTAQSVTSITCVVSGY